MAKVIGPDVSFYQDDNTTPAGIDFIKMKTQADFVIIRVGQNEWIDSDFHTNWAAAKKAGLPRGSYWFYDSRVEPKRQAELWRDALGDDLGELPLCVDLEEEYGGQYGDWRKWYAFIEYLKEFMPEKEIIIYTAYYYWVEHGPDASTQASSLEYFHQYPLWIANYDVAEPRVPAPWGKDEWLLWQYTVHGDGALFGVESGNLDLNYFNGTLEEFRARFNISSTTDPIASTKYKVNLNLRKDPNDAAEVVATLAHDEIVEKLGENADGSWLKFQRESGELGWLSKTFLEQQESEVPDPEPLTLWGQVLPASLNVREGASSLFSVVGTLAQDQVVRVLAYNEDKSWVEILDEDNADGIQGWCDVRYLTLSETKPEPDVEPETQWYLVNVYALNVRQGPSTQYEVVGKFLQDDVIEQLDVDEGGKWFKVRSQEGLVGWVYASYLLATEAPENPDPEPDPPTPDPDPDPADDPQNVYLGRFQVTAYALNLREGASTSNAVVGRLVKGDVIDAIDTTEDGSWRKIQMGDLEGWCSAQYLVRYPLPTEVNQKYFRGAVRYIREVYETPRKMIVNVFVVDTKTEKMKFLVTPPSNNSDAAPMCARTTSEFLEEHGVQFAVNGDGYTHVDPDSVPGLSCPDGRDLLNPNSYAASRGTVYSQRWDQRPIMYINANNEITFNSPKGAVYNAISGDRVLVEKGKIPAGLDNSVLQPRTAVGVNQNGRWMLLIVVDGRQPGYSEGCTLTELAEMLIKYGGVYNAINLDGGGSSAMVMEKDGKAEILNSPIEGGIAGRERLVANHFGIEVK